MLNARDGRETPLHDHGMPNRNMNSGKEKSEYFRAGGLTAVIGLIGLTK
jgi:hypothetical protein